MQLKKSKNYNLPEDGDFIASVNGFQHSSEPREELRFTYKLLSLKSPEYTYYAARTYRVADAEELQRDLYAIAGDGTYDALVDENDNLIPDRLDILLGTKVIIKVEHIHGADHDKPYCKVVSVKRYDPSLN